MTKRRRKFIPLMMLACCLLVADSVANDPAPQEGGSLELLDRGSSDAGLDSLGPPMMATLAVGAAGPGVTMAGVLEVLGPLLPAYQGNFYVAPADFPSSWYPFDVTGVFAFGGMLTPPPPGIMVGAGVAPGPFTGGGGTMWAAFSAMTHPVPPGMTPMVFGAPGSIAPGMVPVPMAPLGVACGLFNDPVAGPNLGGLTLAPMSTVFTFNGPPAADFLAPGATALISWVAGCYVSGATVPVELQSFHID